MFLIHRYLVREFLKTAAIAMTAVLCVFMAVDFFEKVDDFIEHSTPVGLVVSHFLYYLPFVVALILPLIILLAVLFVLEAMNRSNEIVALKSCGIGPHHIFGPVLGLGVIASVFLFVFSETVVPATIREATRIWEERSGRQITAKQNNIWIRGERTIIHIRYFNPVNQEINGISIYTFSDDFRLQQRVDARRGVYRGGGEWVLYTAMEQQFIDGGGEQGVRTHESRAARLDLEPSDLRRVSRKSEDMNFKELAAYIRKLDSEGYDTRIYQVDYYAKWSFPVVCLVMCMLGSGIALRRQTGSNLMLNIAVGILLAFGYWVFHSFCLSLGYGEMLPPLPAAWMADGVFFLIGSWLILKAY